MTRISYDRVPPPKWSPGPSDREQLRGEIGRWIASRPLLDVVRAFGGEADDGPLDERLDALEAFSGEHWDFRGGQERNFAAAAALSPAQVEVVTEAAVALGLVDDTGPSRSRYNYLLILGGLVRACVLRPMRAAELTRQGVISVPRIAALGGFRPLAGDEIGLAHDAGLSQPLTEIDAMDEGMRRAFGLESSPEEISAVLPDDPNRSYLVRSYQQNDTILAVVAAPSTEPDLRRANTADTYEYWARDVARLERGQSLLLVTSAIYVPFQHSDAIRMLGVPYGVEVETVGIDTANDRYGPLRQDYGPTNYLQELRSAIRAMRVLAHSLAE